MINHLYLLRALYPDKGWDELDMAENPNLTIDIVKDFEICDEENDVWPAVTVNKGITLRDIIKYLHLSWDFNVILANPNISLYEVIEHIEVFKERHEKFYLFIKNLDNPKTKKEYGISYNKDVTYGLIKKYRKVNWESYSISMNKGVLWRDILDNLEDGWWDYTAQFNPNITCDDIRNNPSTDIYHWPYLAKNKNIPIQFIREISGEPLTSEMIMANRWSTWELVEELIPEECRDYGALSRAHFVTWDIVKSRLHLPWSWKWICSNANITMEIIISHPDMPWEWKYISSNPNVTAKFVKDNIDKDWDWEKLAANKFNKNRIVRRRLLVGRCFRKWHKVSLRKQHNKKIYESVLDMLRMRIRDLKMGVRATMI